MNRSYTINTILITFHIFDVFGRAIPRLLKVKKDTLYIIILFRFSLALVFSLTTVAFKHHLESVIINY